MLASGPKILDLSYLTEAADGDTNFIREILGDYLKEMNNYVLELNRGESQADMALIGRIAHTIKGASANVGASRVRETAGHLESQLRKGHLEGCTSLIHLLTQEIARVRELVERHTVEQLMQAS